MSALARALGALLLVVSLLGVTAATAEAYSGTAASAEPDFLQRLNDTRAAAGLPGLTLNPALSDYARAWSARLSANGALSHDPQLGPETGAVVPDWTRAGENVGTGGDVAALHQAFYNSLPHRQNMLGAYNQVGIGVVVTNGTIWVTFRFANGSLPRPRDTSGPSSLINPPLAASQPAAKFHVSWWGQDDIAGLAYFNVDVSDNGGAWIPWLGWVRPIDIVGLQASGGADFFGVAGHRYSFRVTGLDWAGNVGSVSPVSSTSVSASAPKPMPFSAAYAVGRDGEISALSSVPIGRPGWHGNFARGFAARAGGGGYVLDLFGGVAATGGAPNLPGSAYWPGWDIARSIALNPDGQGGYVLDGWGGLHPIGNAKPAATTAYWSGWDIARDVVMLRTSTATNPAGYVLDGFGGVHPFGSAPQAPDAPYWNGWNIARDVIANPVGNGGWVLDGWGGMHAFGGAPNLATSAFWNGWDIARSAAIWNTPSGLRGYVLDGYGGLHPINGAPNVTSTRYWGQDIARSVAVAP